MAIYHMQAKVVSRGSGRSAVAACSHGTVLDCRYICGANDCFPHRTFRAADGQDAYSPPTCACV